MQIQARPYRELSTPGCWCRWIEDVLSHCKHTHTRTQPHTTTHSPSQTGHNWTTGKAFGAGIWVLFNCLERGFSKQSNQKQQLWKSKDFSRQSANQVKMQTQVKVCRLRWSLLLLLVFMLAFRTTGLLLNSLHNRERKQTFKKNKPNSHLPNLY